VEFRYGKQSVRGRKWIPEGSPKAVVQIVHGMGEHIGRYGAVADYLNAREIAVFGHDHMGHGRYLDTEHPGDLGDAGWDGLMETTRNVHVCIRKQYSGVPVFLLGHSMGSFISRCLIRRKKLDIQGLILTGAGQILKAEAAGARAFLWAEGKLRKENEPAIGFAKVHGEAYRSLFPKEGPFGWLSSDPEQVRLFEQDPLCGYVHPVRFYKQLIRGAVLAERMEERNREAVCPILIVGGTRDTVGHLGRDPQKLLRKYQQYPGQKAEHIVYPGMRHEVLNEVDRLRVYEDIHQWIERILKSEEL